MCFGVVMVFCCRSYVKRCKQGEHISLQEGNQQFKYAHEQRKGDRENGRSVTGHNVFLSENKDETKEAKYNDVTGGDVCKQTQHQHEWF